MFSYTVHDKVHFSKYLEQNSFLICFNLIYFRNCFCIIRTVTGICEYRPPNHRISCSSQTNIIIAI